MEYGAPRVSLLTTNGQMLDYNLKHESLQPFQNICLFCNIYYNSWICLLYQCPAELSVLSLVAMSYTV